VWGRRTGIILVALSFGTLPLLVATTVPGYTWVIVPIAGATLALSEGFRRTAARFSAAPWILAALSGAFAVLSILSGFLNGFSDEPYSTPAYASLGLAMYTQPVHFTYLQYGHSYVESSYDVYLPLLTYVQVPGLDYRWVALAGWAGMVYLVRKDPGAMAGLSVPWVAALAANGQNDFVPLLALTVALVVRPTQGGWLWELLALGLKQFANGILFLFHLVRREYRAAGLAVVGTLLFLLPFLWVNPGAVWCHVIVGSPTGSCQPHSAGFILFKRNYWLYPVWIALVFWAPIVRYLSRLGGRRLPGPKTPAAAARPPAPTESLTPPLV
jgi:hypothetical protein